MTKVGLVDDHGLMRKGIRSVIESEGNFIVAIEASNGKEFIELLNHELNLELVILDINMPIMNGFETAKYLNEHYPEIKIIALSLLRDETAILNMLNLGAVGYITKNEDPEIFIKAITEVTNKGIYVSSQIKNNILNVSTRPAPLLQ